MKDEGAATRRKRGEKRTARTRCPLRRGEGRSVSCQGQARGKGCRDMSGVPYAVRVFYDRLEGEKVVGTAGGIAKGIENFKKRNR